MTLRFEQYFRLKIKCKNSLTLRFEQRIIKNYYEKLLQQKQIPEFYKHLRFEQRIIKSYYEKLLQKRQIPEF